MPVEGSCRGYACEVGDKIPATAEVFRQGTPHKSLAGRRGTPLPSQQHRPSHCGARRGMGISSVSFRPSGCLKTCCAGGEQVLFTTTEGCSSSSGDIGQRLSKQYRCDLTACPSTGEGPCRIDVLTQAATPTSGAGSPWLPVSSGQYGFQRPITASTRRGMRLRERCGLVAIDFPTFPVSGGTVLPEWEERCTPYEPMNNNVRGAATRPEGTTPHRVLTQ